MAGIVGTGVGGEGFGWSLPLSLGSRREMVLRSFLSMLAHATAQMHSICFFLAQGSFVRSFQGAFSRK